MSRLKKLLRGATPCTGNTQQIPVQACKPVAQHLHAAQQAAFDEAFEERAAIMEYDGGLSRAEAERLGLADPSGNRAITMPREGG